MDKKELNIRCQCQGEVLGITQYSDETNVSLTLYKYQSEEFSIIERIKMAWSVLRGKGISSGDVVLSDENWNKLINF